MKSSHFHLQRCFCFLSRLLITNIKFITNILNIAFHIISNHKKIFFLILQENEILPEIKPNWSLFVYTTIISYIYEIFKKKNAWLLNNIIYKNNVWDYNYFVIKMINHLNDFFIRTFFVAI